MTINREPSSNRSYTKRDLHWEDMFEELAKFRKQHGHCHVPLNEEAYIALGRWVATQRFRSEIDALSPERMQRLTDLGFIWSVADEGWERMFEELKQVQKRLGHCRIPAQWKGHVKLATWVSSQRHKRKKGLMPPDRIQRLDAIGFPWSLRVPCDVHMEKSSTPCEQMNSVDDAAEAPAETVSPAAPENSEEKLYNTAPGVYVQHNDRDPLPPELTAYMDDHNGELPPYIPLPVSPAVFLMGNPFMRRRRKIVWPGHGKLHADILEYVVENGVLPTWE